jgi:hypothetical protein
MKLHLIRRLDLTEKYYERKMIHAFMDLVVKEYLYCSPFVVFFGVWY